MEKFYKGQGTSIPVTKITDEEESKSQNSGILAYCINVLIVLSGIPSEVLRSALKMAFLYNAKYRHVILISKDKKLQQLSETQKVLCVDYEGLENFIEEQRSYQKRVQP